MENIISRIWEIYKIPREKNWKKYLKRTSLISDWYQYYQKDSIREIAEWIKYMNIICPPNYYKGKSVIDMGCGWGLYSILLYLQGASMIYALGPDERVDFLMRIIKEIGYYDRIIPIKLFFDIDVERLIDKEINLIIGNQFLEHLTSKQRVAFFSTSYNTLTKNGLLILHTHNTDNKIVLKRIMLHWQKQEDGIYLKRRMEIISSSFSDLDEKVIIKLAKMTYGKGKNEIIKLCRGYLIEKIMPEPSYELCAVDPITGIPDENYISPLIIQKEMIKSGFKTKIIPWMGYRPLGRHIQPVANLFPRISTKYLVYNCSFWGTKP